MPRCPHCSIQHQLDAHDDCPACGDSLGVMCFDCGNHFFAADIVQGVAVLDRQPAPVCEECGDSRKHVAAKERRRELAEGRGDYMRDQQKDMR